MVTRDGAEQGGDLFGIRDAGEVLRLAAGEEATQLLSGIGLYPSLADGPAEDLADVLAYPVGGFKMPPFLQAGEDGLDVGRVDLGEGSLSQPGEDMLFQPAEDLGEVLRDPGRFHLSHPVFGDRRKRVDSFGLLGLLGLPDFRRILAPGDLLASFAAALAGGLEAHFRIHAQRHGLSATADAVIEAPPFLGLRRDEEIHATTVGEFVSGGFCLSGGDLGVGQLVEHDGNSFQ